MTLLWPLWKSTNPCENGQKRHSLIRQTSFWLTCLKNLINRPSKTKGKSRNTCPSDDNFVFWLSGWTIAQLSLFRIKILYFLVCNTQFMTWFCIKIGRVRIGCQSALCLDFTCKFWFEAEIETEEMTAQSQTFIIARKFALHYGRGRYFSDTFSWKSWLGSIKNTQSLFNSQNIPCKSKIES